MSDAKKHAIHISRKLDVYLPEVAEPVKLHAGRNLVDKEIAEHPFVKAHFTDGPDAATELANPAELSALREEVEILRAENAELKTINAAFTASAGGKKK